jgi:hypothetical protein
VTLGSVFFVTGKIHDQKYIHAENSSLKALQKYFTKSQEVYNAERTKANREKLRQTALELIRKNIECSKIKDSFDDQIFENKIRNLDCKQAIAYAKSIIEKHNL